MEINYKALNDDKIKKPYQFGYEIEDGQGNLQHRHEESDGDGAKVGSYGYVDANGIYRKVEYIADKNGFRVKMSSNEPGIEGYNTPSISMITKPFTNEVTTPVSVGLLKHNVLGDEEVTALGPSIEPVRSKPKAVKDHNLRMKDDHNSEGRHREHYPEPRNNHHVEREKVNSKRKNSEKNRQLDSNRRAYENAFNSFIDRPPPPPTPPRPETPTRLFSTPKSSRSKVSEAEAHYQSEAADWSPRHQDPPSEHQVKSSSNRVSIDKPQRYSTLAPTSPDYEHRSAYDSKVKTKQDALPKPDVNEGHRYYHQALERPKSKVHYPEGNYRDVKKPRQPEKGVEWVSHENQKQKSNSLRSKSDNRWYSNNNDQGKRNDQRSKQQQLKPNQRPTEPNNYQRARDNHHHYQSHHPTQLPSPPAPKVNYDIPEFPLPVMRFHQSSDSLESTERKPTSGQDTSDSYSSEHGNGNHIKSSNHNSGEKNVHHQQKNIDSSEYTIPHHGYLNQGSTEKHSPHQPQVHLPLPPPPPSPPPSAYSSQPSPSQHLHHSSLKSNNQRGSVTRKRPAAYPPTENYQNPMNQIISSNEQQHPMTDLIPKVFYHENSDSSESSSVSSSNELNHQPNQYQNRDWYSFEGDQQSTGPREPVYINKMPATSQEVDHRSSNGLTVNPHEGKQLILSTREDNSASNSNERSRETLTSSSSSAEAYATFKNGLKGLVPLIRKNQDNPYIQSDHHLMEPSERVSLIVNNPGKQNSSPQSTTSSSGAPILIYKD